MRNKTFTTMLTVYLIVLLVFFVHETVIACFGIGTLSGRLL